MPSDGTRVPRRRQRLGRLSELPVLRCRLIAGFGCPPREYDRISRAKHALITTIAIEQKLDLLLENYVEYESELLDLAVRLIAFRDSQWHAFQRENLDVTRRLVNLLSAARLYVDQMNHDLGRLFDDADEIRAAVKQESSARYDASFGFRLMETLRNAIQHRSIAGILLKHHYGTDRSGVREGEARRSIPSCHRARPRLGASLRSAPVRGGEG